MGVLRPQGQMCALMSFGMVEVSVEIHWLTGTVRFSVPGWYLSLADKLSQLFTTLDNGDSAGHKTQRVSNVRGRV